MNGYETQIWWCGTLFEVSVDYTVLDHVFEIEKAEIIGVYHKGDNPRLRDYTSLGTDVPLWGNEMPSWLYDELITKAEEHHEVFMHEGYCDEA